MLSVINVRRFGLQWDHEYKVAPTQLWSQELAQRAGLSVGTIKNMEGKGQASLESFVQVVAALGLVEDLGELFRIKMVSIAAMEQAEKADRQRAPRKPAK